MSRRHVMIALGLLAAGLSACTDATGPLQPDKSLSPSFSRGQTGQCFAPLGVAATQVEPGYDGNVIVTAPAGRFVLQVAVKAGTQCWFTPANASGSFTITIDGAPCYVVEGLGSEQATVTRVGPGPSCKDISHVDVALGAAPPTQALFQLCSVVTSALPPNIPVPSPTFVVAGQEYSLANGVCTDPIAVAAGTVTITKRLNLEFPLLSAATTPADRLMSVDLATETVTVAVVAGSTTVATLMTLWVPDPGGDR